MNHPCLCMPKFFKWNLSMTICTVKGRILFRVPSAFKFRRWARYRFLYVMGLCQIRNALDFLFFFLEPGVITCFVIPTWLFGPLSPPGSGMCLPSGSLSVGQTLTIDTDAMSPGLGSCISPPLFPAAPMDAGSWHVAKPSSDSIISNRRLPPPTAGLCVVSHGLWF